MQPSTCKQTCTEAPARFDSQGKLGKNTGFEAFIYPASTDLRSVWTGCSFQGGFGVFDPVDQIVSSCREDLAEGGPSWSSQAPPSPPFCAHRYINGLPHTCRFGMRKPARLPNFLHPVTLLKISVGLNINEVPPPGSRLKTNGSCCCFQLGVAPVSSPVQGRPRSLFFAFKDLYSINFSHLMS